MQTTNYNIYCLKVNQILKMSSIGHNLPTKFDVVVLGTGLEESMVAAACARIGYSVLHIDPNQYYGGSWASFNFEGIQKWIKDQNQAEVRHKIQQEEKEGKEEDYIVNFSPSNTSSYSNIYQDWYVPFDDESGDKDAWSEKRVEAVAHRFNLDLTPRFLFSRGPMMELLISSNVCRYAEFKCVNRILALRSGWQKVPSSRADIFATNSVTVIEKRLLMKFLTSLYNDDDNDDMKRQTFVDYLRHNQKLTKNIIDFVLHSIAMLPDAQNATVEQGLEATRKFVSSLGRYGSTPFLWCLYGSGELPQSFCRLCAVFGGTYCLERSIEGIITDTERTFKGIITQGQRIESKFMVVNADLCPASLLVIPPPPIKEVNKFRRLICLTSGPPMQDYDRREGSISFGTIPLDSLFDTDGLAYVQQLGSDSGVCPKDMYCLHITSSGMDTDMDEILDRVLCPGSSKIWRLKFDVRSTTSDSVCSISNILVSSGPVFEIDYDKAVDRARKTFKKMFPNEIFLPRAPDPEEINVENYDEPEIRV